jgi:hypothetical protein
MGCNHAVSVRRAGDCLRQGVGPQEAAGVAFVTHSRDITGSSIRRKCQQHKRHTAKTLGWAPTLWWRSL